MMEFLYHNSLISSCQHGFLSKKSTGTNLLVYLDELSKMLDRGNKLDALYIDLAKAFDSVSHMKLVHKLNCIGIKGTLNLWFQNFLSDRLQCVRVGNNVSSLETVVSGIPQGTILGPLLFIVYVNDMVDVVRTNKISLYADDSKLYGISNTVEDCETIKEDLILMKEYLDLWQLKVNIEKCEILSFGNNNDLNEYVLDGNIIEQKNCAKDLGLYISKDLSFRRHYSIIIRNASFRLTH